MGYGNRKREAKQIPLEGIVTMGEKNGENRSKHINAETPAADPLQRIQRIERIFELAESRVGIGYYEVDVTTEKWDRSPGVDRIFGIEALTPVDTAIAGSFIHPADIGRLTNDYYHLQQAGENIEADYRIIRQNDKQERTIRCWWTLERDLSGKPVRVGGFIKDITEQQQAEKATREIQKRLENIIEFLPDAVVVIDKKKKVIAWNRACEAMTGVPKAAMLGLGDYTYAEPFYGERRPMLIDLLDEPDSPVKSRYLYVSQQAEVLQAETITERIRDGRKIHVWCSASPLYDDEGRRFGSIEVIRDITQQKVLEQALLESEESIRVWVESAPEGIYVQRDGKFVFINLAMLKLMGATKPEDLLGTPFMDRVAPESHKYVLERIRFQQNTGATAPAMEQEYLRLDGSKVPVETTAVMVQFQGKKAHLVFVRDRTERKRAEEEKRKLEEQLRQTQKLEAVGKLAGGIAHDFNNLLCAITGYADLMRWDLKKDDPLAKNLGEIITCSQRAVELTRQLLAFSRKQVLEPRLLDLNQVLLNLENMLHRLIGEDIELTLALTPNCGLVKADPGQIEQTIVNLLVNSRDAMPEGGKVTIETSLVQLDESYAKQHIGTIAGPHILLAVTDTGCGMDADTQARIFEPFFTTKEKGKGTGLGLATVYGIVKQSGGNIWCYSEPGKGTSFKVYLPVAAQGAPPALQSRKETDPQRGTETILIAEDDNAIREIASALLRRAGYSVLPAANGGEALLACKNFPDTIHLLVTDVIMPGMSGKMLAKHLQELRPDLKVLFTSGYTDNAIVHHGVLDEGTPFLQKPYNRETLTRKVREVLDS